MVYLQVVLDDLDLELRFKTLYIKLRRIRIKMLLPFLKPLSFHKPNGDFIIRLSIF